MNQQLNDLNFIFEKNNQPITKIEKIVYLLLEEYAVDKSKGLRKDQVKSVRKYLEKIQKNCHEYMKAK